MKTSWIAVLLALAIGLGCTGEAKAQKKIDPATHKLGIQPLVVFRDVDARIIKMALRDFFGFEVRILDPVAMPKVAYTKARKRHRADTLLVVLNKLRLEPERLSDIIVGLTRQDISTTKDRHKDWGIFGLGELWGSACVVSSHRLIRKLGKKDLRRGLRRVVKVAIHEVGHVLGLPHCESPRCVMNDAKGTIKTVDLETGHLCEKCQAVLKSRFDYPDDHGFDVRWDFWLNRAGK